MSAFLNDTFTDSNGTALTSHTGETGATWTRNTIFGSGTTPVIATNRVRPNDAATVIVMEASGTPPSADYYVEAVMRPMGTISAGDSAHVILRSNGSDTFYSCAVDANAGTVTLLEYPAGTTLGTPYSMSFTAGVDYTIRLEAIGSALKVYINGVERISATDATITAAGKAGLIFAFTTSDTEGLHIASIVGDMAAPSTPDEILVNDAGLFFSPYTWRKSGSSFAVTCCHGAYIKTSFTGTYVGLQVDVSALTGASAAAEDYPRIQHSIDGGAWEDTLLTSSSSNVTLASGLADTTHSLVIRTKHIDGDEDNWVTQVAGLKVTALLLNTGETVSAPTLRADRMIVYGDSITCGSPVTASLWNSFWSYVEGLAEALDCEVGNIGAGSTGWLATSPDGWPGFNDSWDLYSSGQTRLSGGLLSPAPDYLVINHGENDGTLAHTDVSAKLAGIRTAAGANCWIFVVTPFGGRNKTTIETGVANYITASSDAKIAVIDGTIPGCGINVGAATFSTTDGVHPDPYAQGRAAAVIAEGIKDAIGGGTGYTITVQASVV